MKELLVKWTKLNNAIQTEVDANISAPMVSEFRSIERYIQEKLDKEKYTIGDILDILDDAEDIDIDIELWSEETQAPLTQANISVDTPVKFMRLYFELVIFI